MFVALLFLLRVYVRCVHGRMWRVCSALWLVACFSSSPISAMPQGTVAPPRTLSRFCVEKRRPAKLYGREYYKRCKAIALDQIDKIPVGTASLLLSAAEKRAAPMLKKRDGNCDEKSGKRVRDHWSRNKKACRYELSAMRIAFSKLMANRQVVALAAGPEASCEATAEASRRRSRIFRSSCEIAARE